MTEKEYIRMGLEGAGPLKLILCGSVEEKEMDKIGVVSVVWATLDAGAADRRLYELKQENPDNYYMVYSVPLDKDLTELEHYPSIEITKEDLV